MNVALYLRRSTNDRLQADSLTVQEQILRRYAEGHEMKVVVVFRDSASGTSTKERKDFLRMAEIITHKPSFEAVLTRDVSRFGRFFDVDEGAFFEVLFLGHGVRTIYCEEAFGEDTSPMASLIKSVRRVMASEYSRDRSRLIRYAQSRATRLGFHAAGPPPFGMRRVMVTKSGEFVRDLHPGQWKALANHRTRLVPGDPAAVRTIQIIFDLYTRGATAAAIVAQLNADGVAGPHGGRWYEGSVLGVLANSVYAGIGHYRPRPRGLTDTLTADRRAELRVEDGSGHTGVVEKSIYLQVQERLSQSIRRRSNMALSGDARRAFEAHGCVERCMLEALSGHCSWGTYEARFARGIDEALENAYTELITRRSSRLNDILRTDLGSTRQDDVWTLQNSLRVSLAVAFPHRRNGCSYWRFRAAAVSEIVVGFGILPNAATTPYWFVFDGSRLTVRSRGLYLCCHRRYPAYEKADADLAAAFARRQRGPRQRTSDLFLRAARSKAALNLSELARELFWPYDATRKMYWNLASRGEWMPPLKYRAGRVLEITCAACGVSRRVQPSRALSLRGSLCLSCSRSRQMGAEQRF